MPKVTPIYTSFVTGEVSENVAGRSDLDQYGSSLETAENVIIRPYGNVINTGGTQYITSVKTPSKATRLLRFVFNRSDAYIIEMGETYFRFFTDQGAVLTGGGSVYEVAHTYTESQLFDVQYAQNNDVIYMTHPDVRPKTLTRTSAASWTFADFAYKSGPFLDDNTSATTITASADTGAGITLTASTSIFASGHVGSIWRVKSGYVEIKTYASATSVTADVLYSGDLDTSAAAVTDWAEAAWSSDIGYPARITFHEKRLFMARTAYEPQKLWASKSFIYDDFDTGAEDDDGLNFQIASDEANEIQWISSGNVLSIGTFGGEFVVGTGTSGSGLTPSNINATRQTGWGSVDIQPKKIGNFIFFADRFGKKIRQQSYSWDLDNYKSDDTTILADHITGDGVTGIAYQQNPDSVMWCVRSDGQMATMTREIDQKVTGWSRQVTDGYYESVETIPNATENYDEVWVVVKRTIDGSTVRYIELFENPVLPTRQDEAFYVHSGLKYSAYDQTSTKSLTLSALTGSSVTFTSSASHFTASGAVSMRLRAIDSDGVTLGEAHIDGYNSTTEISGTVIKDFDSLTYTSGTWGISIDQISGLDHLEGEDVSIFADGGVESPNPINGDLEYSTVASGAVSLNYNYFVVNAGLPFESTIFTLPLEGGSAIGTAQGKRKKIYQLAMKVNKTLGIEVGGSSASLDKVQFRDPPTLMGTPESFYTGILPNINFNADVVYDGQIMIKQRYPLPMNILNVIPFVNTNDK